MKNVSVQRIQRETEREKEERRRRGRQSMRVCRGDEERGSWRESDGSRQSRAGEGGSVREWWGSKHALHVIQSVHMALHYAVINT